MSKIIVQCANCGKNIKRYNRNNLRSYCSRTCKYEFMRGKSLEEIVGENRAKEIKKKISEATSGENNPNFNNKWTAEQRKNGSEISKKRFEDLNMRYLAGSANRGVKFNNDRIQAMHGNRTFESYSRPLSEESKKKIGIKSSKKFENEDFVLKYRNIMIEKGHWVRDSAKNDWTIFKYHSCWVKRMWDYCDPILLKKFGIFNARTNRSGLVRDHILSKRFAFDNKLFPEIIRHPENCRFIKHNENAIKGKKSLFTICELFDKIKNTQFIWEEQDLVLQLITRWENGEHFLANNYRRESI